MLQSVQHFHTLGGIFHFLSYANYCRFCDIYDHMGLNSEASVEAQARERVQAVLTEYRAQILSLSSQVRSFHPWNLSGRARDVFMRLRETHSHNNE